MISYPGRQQKCLFLRCYAVRDSTSTDQSNWAVKVDKSPERTIMVFAWLSIRHRPRYLILLESVVSMIVRVKVTSGTLPIQLMQ